MKVWEFKIKIGERVFDEEKIYVSAKDMMEALDKISDRGINIRNVIACELIGDLI